MPTTGPRIALVTCEAYPQLYDEEQQLPALLARSGVDARPVVWSDDQVDWRSFDGVVLRTTWDYFEKLDAFRAWLAQVASLRLCNPLELMRWNFDKRYLRDLEAAGARIVPTRFVDERQPIDLAAAARALDCAEVVLKPAISGGAFRTHRFAVARAAEYQAEADSILQSSGLLLQPYCDEITAEGEWSLLFFDGKYSHAVLKQPAPGDFRVQMTLGGTFHRVEPAPALIDEATRMVRGLPQPALYARVDGVRRGGRFLLMEIELIEPYLFLAVAPEAAQRYVDALVRWVRDR
jgi:hypothetical protein